jgi:hypothetical protein
MITIKLDELQSAEEKEITRKRCVQYLSRAENLKKFVKKNNENQVDQKIDDDDSLSKIFKLLIIVFYEIF